ncbi:MAG TPA: hypothetical protein VHM90_16480 [Phycisphaerae bacterium]|nr:hypothetical protein [Phycisphaerae bacterium]
MNADPFDQALSKRLSKLSTLPVDTSHLDRALRAEIGGPTQQVRWQRMLRPASAVAASLILITLVALALLQNRTAQASPEAMLQFHRDVVSGKIATMQVDSVDELNKAFDAFSANGVRVETMPDMPMSCCVKDIANKRVTCVLLKDNSGPVTLSIAESDAFKPLNTSPVMHNGEAFHVQTAEGLTMVTVDRGNHRVCLIGAQPAGKLMALADGLHF